MFLKNPPLLEFKNVTVLRGGRRALDRVTLTLPEGEDAAILGPNGSGKSTLIHAITRECYPLIENGSSLRVFGEDLWNVTELQARLGIVSSDLYDACRREISVEETVISGFFGTIGLWPHLGVKPDMVKRARAILKKLGILPLKDRMMDAISSGEARRVLIARALVHEPQALLLDEPTNSLDPKSRLDFIGFIRTLAKKGCNIIMVTHHLHERLKSIPGTVPQAWDRPKGCPFHPRCGFAQDVCRTSEPAMIDLGNGHLSRCFFAGKLK